MITSEWFFVGKYWISGDQQEPDSEHYKGCVRVLPSGKKFRWEFMRTIRPRGGNPAELEVTTGRYENRWSLLGLSGPDKPTPKWEEGYFDTVWDAVKDAEYVLERHFGVAPESKCPRKFWHPLLERPCL